MAPAGVRPGWTIIKERKGEDTLVLDGNREDYDVSFRGNDMVIKSKDGQTNVVIKNQIGGPDIENFQFTGKPLPGNGPQAPTGGDTGCCGTDDALKGGSAMIACMATIAPMRFAPVSTRPLIDSFVKATSAA